MLPEGVASLLVNTGNLISCKEFKRKATQSPTEEVFESVSGSLASWIKTYQPGEASDAENLTCVNSDHALTVDKEDRVNLKLTVKVFLECFSCEALKMAISKAMAQLDVSFIDSVILALPSSSSQYRVSLDEIKPLWVVLEELVQNGKVLTIGISDLDTGQLTELHQWAQMKPSVNQVNLESCCVMPPEMTAFAKENDIQLLTHSDPKVLLPQDLFEKSLEPVVLSPSGWKASWIVRYSVVMMRRGIMQNKGYLLCAVKEAVICNGPS